MCGDARGLVTHTVYDAQGRKTEVDYPPYTPPGSTTAITPKEFWTYDNNGNVLSYTNKAGQTTRYAYDMRNRAYQITLPPAASGATPGVIQRVYDDNGNLLSQIDPTGAQTLYTYDDMDRMTTLDRVVRNGTPC